MRRSWTHAIVCLFPLAFCAGSSHAQVSDLNVTIGGDYSYGSQHWGAYFPFNSTATPPVYYGGSIWYGGCTCATVPDGHTSFSAEFGVGSMHVHAVTTNYVGWYHYSPLGTCWCQAIPMGSPMAQYGWQSGNTYRLCFSDLVFVDQADPTSTRLVDVYLNLNFRASLILDSMTTSLNVGVPGFDDDWAQAWVDVRMMPGTTCPLSSGPELSGQNLALTLSPLDQSPFLPQRWGTPGLADYPNDYSDRSMVWGPFRIPLGSAVSLSLHTDAKVQRSSALYYAGVTNSTPGRAEAEVQIELPTGSPVFNAPPGITVNSTQAKITNNLWTGAPRRILFSGNHHYYEIVTNQTICWSEARAAAQARGGDLATITSSSEQSIVQALINLVNPPTGSIFIGLTKQTDGTFGWVTGEPLSYNHWATGEPNNSGGSENRGAMYWTHSQPSGRSFFWNDTADCPLNCSCDYGYGSYIIEYPCEPVISTQPASLSVMCGGPATFVVGAKGLGPFSYQWRRGGQAITGANSSVFTIPTARGTNAGSYSCVVTNGCGSSTTVNAALTVTNCCPSDLDDGTGTGTPDGGTDINDLLYFLAAYEAGGNAADLDDGTGSGTPDGCVDINDLLFFLAHYEAGC